ncbi:MAG: hypothetical protein HFH48_08400, partial [Lachnospiraceae bacterium]|nr:hypothetical protein [Lachnospiraceae bacterium]
MRKMISVGLVCLVMAGLITGCGKSLEANRDTVYVQKKGTVVSAAIADLDKDYYDEEELKSYIDERVEILIRILAWSVPLEAVHACINGYYYGQKKAGVPAL